MQVKADKLTVGKKLLKSKRDKQTNKKFFLVVGG